LEERWSLQFKQLILWAKNMTMTAAEKLRAHLLEQSERKPRSSQSTGDNASYPFWNMPEGTTATVRFLPDADPNSPTFWVTREVIKLKFAGQVGGDYPTEKQVVVTVPCVDMFGDTCPIIAETRPWWKQGGDKEALAREYYKKKSYIFQGFVVNTPFEEPSVPENPIRRFVINPSIFDIIKTSLMNPEMEDLPTDYVGGRDFKIAKTRKGDYANYANSTWSFRTRALNEMENVAIEQYGLWNLSEFRGTRPDADGIEMIRQMFHDSLAGKPFDFDAYGKFYRAYGDRNNAGNGNDPDATTTVTATKPTPSVTSRVLEDEDSEVSESSAVSSSSTSAATKKPTTQASDILERIRKKTLADKS